MNKINCLKEKCPSRNIITNVSDKWSILLITALLRGIFRFGELKRKVEGISPKMATQTLRKLERFGLVKKTIYPEKTLKVEYQLTPLGNELGTIIQQLTTWTETNTDALLNAESKFNQG